MYRFAVKTLLWSMGIQVEVLNMTDSSDTSLLPSVDFLNRSDSTCHVHLLMRHPSDIPVELLSYPLIGPPRLIGTLTA